MDKVPHQSAVQRWTKLLELPPAEGRREAASWDWFALLRLVQSADPSAPRIGHHLFPHNEGLRFGQPPFFHHPASAISDLKRLEPGENKGWKASITSYHLGLFGPNGPLPMHLNEFADRQMRKGDAGLVSFCNLLSHRFISFFFRAWAQSRKELTLDRPAAISQSQASYAFQDIGQHGENLWEFLIGCMIGCGIDSKTNSDSLSTHAKLFYAGRFLPPNRSAEGLRALIEDYFELRDEKNSKPSRQVRTNIIEFRPRTLPIPLSAQWKLGSGSTTGFLGLSTIVGSSFVDYQCAFRIQVGPLNYAQFKEFLPDGERFRKLHDWVRYYCGEETDPNPEAGVEAAWELQLILLGEEVPPLKLGGTVQLGYTTWLCSEKPKKVVGDFVVRPRKFSGPPRQPNFNERASWQ